MCEYIMKTNHCAYEWLKVNAHLKRSVWQRCKIVSGSLLSPFSLLLSLSLIVLIVCAHCAISSCFESNLEGICFNSIILMPV